MLEVDLDGQTLVWGPAGAPPILLDPIEAVLWRAHRQDHDEDLAGDLTAALGVPTERAADRIAHLRRRWSAHGVEHPTPGTADALGHIDWDAAVRIGDGTSLHAPVVATPTCLAAIDHRERSERVNLCIGSLRLAVTIEPTDMATRLRHDLHHALVPDHERRAYSVSRLTIGSSRRFALLSDGSLPLAIDAEPDPVYRRLLSELRSLGELTSKRWPALRLRVLARDGQCVLVQPEYLFDRVRLGDGLTARGWDLVGGPWALLEAETGSVSVVVDGQRLRPLAVVVCPERSSLAVPRSGAERVWMLALFASLGTTPRCGDRLAIVEALRGLEAAATTVTTRSFAAGAVLGFLDHLDGP